MHRCLARELTGVSRLPLVAFLSPSSQLYTTQTTASNTSHDMLFSSLPDDALLHLFEMVISQHRLGLISDRIAHRRKSTTPLAMRLSQIASFTRLLVRNAPLLWTVIDDLVLQNTSHLYLHLDRSRQCLLDILGENFDDEEMFSNLMPLLAHVHRWRRLRLGLSSKIDLLMIFAAFKKLRLEKLEELQLSFVPSDGEYDDEDETPIPITTRIFRHGTPYLKKLHLCSVSVLPSTTNHLTHLKLHNLPFQPSLWSYLELTKMLGSMKSLMYLSMTGTIAALPATISKQFLSMPALRSVKLNIEDDDDEFAEYEDGEGDPYFAAILALFINTPIKRLYFLQPSSGSLPPILNGMRHRGLCFPTVTELYWGIDLESNDDAVTFIGAFPAVQCFYLLDTGDTILDTLIGSTKVGFQALWRHMHTIHLDAPDIPKARQLVESRKNAGMPLRCLRMRKPKPKGHISDLHWLSSRLKVFWVSDDQRMMESTE